MFDPKWAILAVVLAAFGLAASYDLRLGLAAGAAIGVVAAIYLTIRMTLSYETGEEGSNRAQFARRLSRLSRNRRRAQAQGEVQAETKTAKVAKTPPAASGAQARPQPGERP